MPRNQSTVKQSDQFSIYDYNKREKRTWRLIKNEISDVNVRYIEDYEMSMVTDNLAKAGRQKHLETLLSLSRIVERNKKIKDKDWNNLTKRDIDILIRIINDTYKNPRGKETWSSHDHKKILKIFFRWLKLGNRKMKKVGDPPETKDVVVGDVESEIMREELLNPDDRRKLLEGCNGNLRNIALIDCSFDAGPRAGEILNCKLKHIIQDKYGYKIEVDGKTGQRPIRIIKAASSLAKWLDAHPFKDKKNSAAWPKQSGKDKDFTPLSYAAARQAIVRASNEAKKKFSDFDKRVCFTLLRPDDYHIFCGVNKELKNYVTYRRKRNLKSAQMDFVVVSRRGVSVIEVKNWSSFYYKNHYGIPPHEQVDRAGRVLWITLKSSWFSPKNPPVTSVLLSIQGNINYDENYGYIKVKNLNNINYFLQNKEEQFSDKEVSRIIGRIKGDITK